MKLERLRGRKICERVLAKGIRWQGKTFNARIVFGHPRHPAAEATKNALYMGTVASTKLSKRAVERNRMRRRCREALRMALQGLQDVPTAQLLLLPRSTSLKCPFAEIQADVSALLTSLHGKR